MPLGFSRVGSRQRGNRGSFNESLQSAQVRGGSTTRSQKIGQAEADSMYDRLLHWKQEKLKKLKMTRRHEIKQQDKAFKYKPDVSKSQHSIVLMNNRR